MRIDLTEEEQKILLGALSYLQSKAKQEKNTALFISIQTKVINGINEEVVELKQIKTEDEKFLENINTTNLCKFKKGDDNDFQSNSCVSDKKKCNTESKPQIATGIIVEYVDKYKIGTKVLHRVFGKGEIINANKHIIRVYFSGEILNFSRVTLEKENVIEIISNEESNDLTILLKKSDEYFYSKEKNIKEKISIQHRVLIELTADKELNQPNSLILKYLLRLMNLYKDDNQIEEAYASSLEILKLDSKNLEAQNVKSLYNKGPYYSQESKATDFQRPLWSGGLINLGDYSITNDD